MSVNALFFRSLRFKTNISDPGMGFAKARHPDCSPSLVATGRGQLAMQEGNEVGSDSRRYSATGCRLLKWQTNAPAIQPRRAHRWVVSNQGLFP